MKYVKLWGGLGNQIFQFYFRLFVKTRSDGEVAFYTRLKCPDIRRNFDFLGFTLSDSFLNCINDASASSFHSTIIRAKRFIIKWLPFLSSRLCVENVLLGSMFKDSLVYDGYWQDYRVIEEVYKLSPIVISNAIFSNFQNMLVSEIDSANSVSVHVRRGDKLSCRNRLTHSRLSSSYYFKAIELLKSKIENPVFYVFSDDIEWVKKLKLFQNTDSVVFVSSNVLYASDKFEFYAMSRCKNNIISASTYSWWAAWINLNPEKVIVAPKKWYVLFNKRKTVNLIPSDWIKL